MRIGKMDRPQTNFVDLCFWKYILKETFWRSVETFSLLSDQNCKSGLIKTEFSYLYSVMGSKQLLQDGA